MAVWADLAGKLRDNRYGKQQGKTSGKNLLVGSHIHIRIRHYGQ